MRPHSQNCSKCSAAVESAALTLTTGQLLAGALVSWALGGLPARAEHHGLLTGLRASLPQPRGPSLEATMRRSSCDGRSRRHGALRAIVAIDSRYATCSDVATRGRPLASDLGVGSILQRIHKDEARHVAIASAVRLRCCSRCGERNCADALEQLTQVLRLRPTRWIHC